jgi:hypothetical protein
MTCPSSTVTTTCLLGIATIQNEHCCEIVIALNRSTYINEVSRQMLRYLSYQLIPQRRGHTNYNRITNPYQQKTINANVETCNTKSDKYP